MIKSYIVKPFRKIQDYIIGNIFLYIHPLFQLHFLTIVFSNFFSLDFSFFFFIISESNGFVRVASVFTRSLIWSDIASGYCFPFDYITSGYFTVLRSERNLACLLALALLDKCAYASKLSRWMAELRIHI